MLDAMKYHFRHLTDFSGRDARQTFWYWFLFLFIVNIAVSMAVSVPAMVGAMATGFEVARSGDPAAAELAIMNQMAGSMRMMIVVSIVLGLVNLALMAAAFVRRLHDSGKPGLWAAIAGVIYLGSLALAWSRIDDAAELMRTVAMATDPVAAIDAQSQMAWSGLLGYVPLILVVVFGVLKSDPGPNKYGAEPVRF